MMNTDQRPDPDQLLARVQAEERRITRGRLKIFLGYAAGVGKTYAMLEAARQRKDQGVDVVIGYIETHGRKETDALLDGLEILPRRQSNYRGVNLTELDLDGVLARRPQLVLVDELAHTNIPESRHIKRYQDVEELLAAGMDVYTTINVQHLESMNDVVRQITGVTVRETIPDRIMDEADEIEVIDLPPDELIQRLMEGKVYISQQAAQAVEKFFRKGNLTALREISLRRAAERVDDQMRSYMQAEAIPGPWPAGDHILVCLSSHPLGERLIRAGRRLADDLNAEWTVVFVETPGHIHMPPDNRERIMHNLNLAEQMGARVEIITGTSVVDTVLAYAHRNNITKIIAGKPLRPRWYEFLRGGSVVDQIIHQSGSIDVYVVSEETGQTQSGLPITRMLNQHWDNYLKSILIVIAFTLFNSLIHIYLEPTNLVMIYLAGVVISAVWLGRGPSILASLLSVLVFDFFFVNPRFSFAVSDTQYVLTFIGLMVVGLVISSSASLLRDQVDQLRRREANARAVSALSKELTAAVDLESVLQVVIRVLGSTFEREVVILLPDGSSLIENAASRGFSLNTDEFAVALWAYQNNQPAGRGTDTLSAADIRFLPLTVSQGVVGVLGVKSSDTYRYLTPEERLLLDNFANLAALAIERATFAEQASQAEALRSTERLQSALLNSISHELRTPLASIMGALTSLEDDATDNHSMRLDDHTRMDLIQSAAGQARALNRLVGNLLDMTRLQSGVVRLNTSLTDLEELVGAVLVQMDERIGNRRINVKIPDDVPMITIDAVLIGQALINLLDNALKFSPAPAPVNISVHMDGQFAWFCVRDHGPGITKEESSRIFDKFYRGSTAVQTVGTGLGLAICREIVEAHHGTIRAENAPDGGLQVLFSVPLSGDAD